MSVIPKANKSGTCESNKGFAIVMALSLLSLVFLLVISLVNLVGIDLSLADTRKEKVLAQAHARMGMMVAIGELQKHLGPDTRVSATADILDERIESGKKYESTYYLSNSSTNLQGAVSKNQAIDLNENGQLDTVPFGQRYWTGVWKHRARRKGASDDYRAAKPLPNNLETSDSISATAMADSEYDPHPAVEVAWLVSGNEGWSKKPAFMQGPVIVKDFLEIPDGIPDDQRFFTDPNGGIYGNERNAWLDYQYAVEQNLKDYDHPLLELPDPEDSNDVVWMLRRALLEEPIDEDGTDDWKSNLRGEPIKVSKTHVSAKSTTDRLNSHGAYAYWIGDEGVKSKLNISLSDKESSNLQNQMDDLAVAKKPNIEFTDTSDSNDGPGTGGFGLKFKLPDMAKKVHSLAFLDEQELLEGDETLNRTKLAAHFHSLTTNSHGVLADVRTGGLKRDLSHAFANERDWDGSLEQKAYNWIDDFIGFIYRDRVHVLKSVPMEPGAKSNMWNDTAATESINDYKGVLSGPLWRTLGSFHNMYLKIAGGATSPRVQSQPAEAVPRFSGDNLVLFDPRNGRPEARGKPFWTQTQTNPILAINTRLNWFQDTNSRPGPKSHPVQPVLLEFKYSQVPTLSGANLALAMYPSVALWNPYNVALSMNELYVEVPIHRATINTMNPKEYDRWRKWFMWVYYQGVNGGGGGGVMRPPPLPPGFPNWGGRGPVGTVGAQGSAGYLLKAIMGQAHRDDPFLGPNPFNRFFEGIRGGRNLSHYRRKAGSPGYSQLYSDMVHNFRFLNSNDSVNPTTGLPSPNLERHLLLRISGLVLDAGEKAHFTVGAGQSCQWSDLPAAGSPKQYLQVSLTKGIDQHPFIFQTDFAVPNSEPLGVENIIGRVQGVHPNQLTFYHPNNATRLNSLGNYPEPKGITIYSQSPCGPAISPNIYSSLPVSQRKPIFKITKTFDISAGFDRWCTMINPHAKLRNSTFIQNGLPGNGIRLRYKLPGTADKIVLEQYNVRSLVQSYQDGFGDNWKAERFVGSRYNAFNSNIFTDVPRRSYTVNHDDRSYTFNPNSMRFVDFYEFANNGSYDGNLTLDQAITPLNSPNYHGLDVAGFNPFMHQIVPRITSSSSSIGFFHDEDEMHGPMDVEEEAVLFDVPTSPMLSILQLRHANLSDYSHAPSYILGNSYATPQVSRYKTWGRVRTIAWKPTSILFDIANNWASHEHFKQAYQTGSSPWEWFIADRNLYIPRNRANYGSVRDVNAQNEHQNTTLDHSYYANRALLDGFFMSGVGHDQWQTKSLSQMQAEKNSIEIEEAYRPYRNPRLVPFLRDDQLTETSYGKLSEEVLSTDDRSYRYQTLAADLLLEGAFNVNSTSVDAWISQLSSLRGLPLPNSTSSSQETPVLRFLNQPSENSWNQIRQLSDDEITLLAHCLVEQIKLRGPFLSFSDFANRRIQGTPANLLSIPLSNWRSFAQEDRDSVLGLRGAVQSAIAEAGLNQPDSLSSGSTKGSWPDNPMIPTVPSSRFNGPIANYQHFLPPANMGFISSIFGLYAVSAQPYSHPHFLTHTWASFNSDHVRSRQESPTSFGLGKTTELNFFAGSKADGTKHSANFINWTPTFSFKAGWDDFEGASSFGEAPDNILAVENVATAANKPGWVMQSDVLSPLAPVTSVRSDTFIIRVMGEPKRTNSTKIPAKAWIELTVQRTPDYVKPHLDAPHHRPHEPFEDRNLNGYWDNDPSFSEHWLDLNQNGMDTKGEQTLGDAQPDLPGRGIYRDGFDSDLPLNPDPDEEDSSATVSRMGINQRFGRKFKIIKFRWIKEQDV